MKYRLLHLWGPFAIHSYGVCIALGLALFTLLVTRDQRFNLLNLRDHFFAILTIGIGGTLLGGRILYALSEQPYLLSPVELFTFWQGGFSILGGVIGVLISVPAYLMYYKIPVLPFFDLIAIYAGLLQSIARVGCFFAGCCFGKPFLGTWAVQYTDHLCAAPLYQWLHPAQLYSALTLFIIFLLMKYFFQTILKKPGQLATTYLILISLERFIIDFWRDDRILSTPYFSYNQWVALGLLILATLAFVQFSYAEWRVRTV